MEFLFLYLYIYIQRNSSKESSITNHFLTLSIIVRQKKSFFEKIRPGKNKESLESCRKTSF